MKAGSSGFRGAPGFAALIPPEQAWHPFAMRPVPYRMAGRALGFRSYHFCWCVVAPILRCARLAGPLRGPRGIRIRQPARMKAPPSGFRRRVRLSLSFCPSGVCGFRHAPRSGPHGGAGVRLPLVSLLPACSRSNPAACPPRRSAARPLRKDAVPDRSE